jgi:hypothetical protein
MDQTFDIFIDELTTDEEFRASFLRDPRQTLERADEWGLPLSASEIRSVLKGDRRTWMRVAEALSACQLEAA